MTPADFTGLIGDLWTTWAPGILATAAIVVAASVAIHIALRFAPSVAVGIFRRK